MPRRAKRRKDEPQPVQPTDGTERVINGVDVVDGGDSAEDPKAADPEATMKVEAAEDGAAEQASAELHAELERAKADAAGHYDRLLRSQAELQNVLRRHERDRLDRLKYAGEALARDLLPVVDDLERALAHGDEQSAAVVEGVALVYKSLLSVLARHGVERIEAKGKPFDPAEHEAVATVETAEQPENTVVHEHRAGYRLHDRLLRPTMVVVAKAPAA